MNTKTYRGRVIWGSDEPWFPMRRSLTEARELPLDDDAMAQFLGGTARRLLDPHRHLTRPKGVHACRLRSRSSRDTGRLGRAPRHLQRDDVIALQLPGFGCPRPAGFGATKEEYVAWLVGELEQIAPQGPIDLVGHDWGGGFVVRLVSTRADLVRSWVCDMANFAHASVRVARLRQDLADTQLSEDFFASRRSRRLRERTRRRSSSVFGVSLEAAIELGRPMDQTMADFILRSVPVRGECRREWAPDFHDIPKPGCILAVTTTWSIESPGTPPPARLVNRRPGRSRSLVDAARPGAWCGPSSPSGQP